MTVASKLMCHLEHIVMPKNVPLTGPQIMELCRAATLEQRVDAVIRSRIHNPRVLDDEMEEAVFWVRHAGLGYPIKIKPSGDLE